MKNVKKIEVRIYHNYEILEENPEIDEILPVMDKIQRYSRILEELEENYDEGFDSYGSST